jgi:hypothetical protein
MVCRSTHAGKAYTSPNARCRKRATDRGHSASRQALPDPEKHQIAGTFADTFNATGNTAVQVGFRPWAVVRAAITATPSRDCFNTRCQPRSPRKTALRRLAPQQDSRRTTTASETSPVNLAPMLQRAKIGRCRGYAVSILDGRPGRALDMTQRPSCGVSEDLCRRPVPAVPLNHKPDRLADEVELTFVPNRRISRAGLNELVQKKFQKCRRKSCVVRTY